MSDTACDDTVLSQVDNEMHYYVHSSSAEVSRSALRPGRGFLRDRRQYQRDATTMMTIVKSTEWGSRKKFSNNGIQFSPIMIQSIFCNQLTIDKP